MAQLKNDATSGKKRLTKKKVPKDPSDGETGSQKGQACPIILLYHRLKLECSTKLTQSFTLCVMLKVTCEHDMALVLRVVTTW